MDKQFFREVEHAVNPPLIIERRLEGGLERIVIEGVVYDADYFREFANPETDVLYAVRRDSDGVVCLTVIRDELEAKNFFEQVGDCFAAENKDAARNDIGDDENAI